MDDPIIMIGMAVLFAVFTFVLPQLRLRKDIPNLIRLFREAKATGIKNAKTQEELGLSPKAAAKSMFSMFGGGDPVQKALQALKKDNIIKSTEDGKLYLSLDDLMVSKWRGN